MPEFIPESILIQMLNFLVLLFLLNIIVYKPVRGIMDKRKEEMDSSKNMTGEWNQKIEMCSTELEDNIESTRKQGLKERIDLKNNGLETEKELLQDAYSQVEDVIGKAKAEIKDKINNARVSLQNEMDAFSQELAEKILGRSL